MGRPHTPFPSYSWRKSKDSPEQKGRSITNIKIHTVNSVMQWGWGSLATHSECRIPLSKCQSSARPLWTTWIINKCIQIRHLFGWQHPTLYIIYRLINWHHFGISESRSLSTSDGVWLRSESARASSLFVLVTSGRGFGSFESFKSFKSFKSGIIGHL